jgi:hypothetical protein
MRRERERGRDAMRRERERCRDAMRRERERGTLLDGSNVRLNWNIESDMNVNWIKFKNCLSLY